MLKMKSVIQQANNPEKFVLKIQQSKLVKHKLYIN